MSGLTYVVAKLMGPVLVCIVTARKCGVVHVCVRKVCFSVCLTSIATPSCRPSVWREV